MRQGRGGDFLSWKQRQRRMAAALEEAWSRAGHTPEDPGLREAYEQIPRAPIRLIACPLRKDVNQGGLLRLGDAFRIEEVTFSPEPDGAVDRSGHRGTAATQPHRWISAETALEAARGDGYATVAVTLSERAVPLEGFEWRFPLAIVLGAEVDGVPPEVEAACEARVAIPLYGLVTSLNVATAAAIVLHAAVGAYARQNPAFQPVRQASRRLLGLPPVDYSEL